MTQLDRIEQMVKYLYDDNKARKQAGDDEFSGPYWKMNYAAIGQYGRDLFEAGERVTDWEGTGGEIVPKIVEGRPYLAMKQTPSSKPKWVPMSDNQTLHSIGNAMGTIPWAQDVWVRKGWAELIDK